MSALKMIAAVILLCGIAGCQTGVVGNTAKMEHQDPFCQSCAMPMAKPADFGTSADGTRVSDYCCYCFQNGQFTEPEITMQQMIDKCVTIMGQQGIMPEPQARAMMTEAIPKLKRWQTK